jgi:hypothetical protein
LGPKESAVRTGLSIALLGLTLGGVTFLVTGLSAYVAIAQLRDQSVVVARAPSPAATVVRYAQAPPTQDQ